MRSYSRGEQLPHDDRNDFANLTKLSPYVWRYSKRVSIALGCLLLAKFATVCTPLVLKEIIDALDRQTDGQLSASLTLAIPLATCTSWLCDFISNVTPVEFRGTWSVVPVASHRC